MLLVDDEGVVKPRASSGPDRWEEAAAATEEGEVATARAASSVDVIVLAVDGVALLVGAPRKAGATKKASGWEVLLLLLLLLVSFTTW